MGSDLSQNKAITTCFTRLALAGRKLRRAILRPIESSFKKKEELTQWLETHRSEIELGELIVLFQDECHLLWGDLCGYVWGKTNQRIEVPIVNERSKQTYYGVVNLATQHCFIQAYERGNSQNTIQFLDELLQQYPQSRIALLWDGASYHRSHELKAYLQSVNGELSPEQWRITCKRFAPNDPTQNPIEDIWLHGKRLIREWYHLCHSFDDVKGFFQFATHDQFFHFPKLFEYGHFSLIT